ncbi:MAG TPA: flagellar hook-basal body complex protein FliE [Rudaea sp.]
MSDATISSILSQIRSLQQQAAFRPDTAEKPAAIGSQGGFGESLKQALGRIDGDQKQAQNLAQRFELGDPNVTLSRVMLAQQTAQVSFRATVEARNRLVQAYQDVMNMPL